ncbi:Uncharacterized protein PHSC3_001615 [Chlamydiales bacterium STE3]|nr:Uncharacterized protein PHSC3_001615 [Chlamydiales bacterium STE3]
MSASALPKPFVWRRAHSLAGFWLSIYLVQHLLVNSQAALLFGQDGEGFIRAVNAIQELPYLPLIEWTILGVPIAIHMWWGVQYLKTSKMNSFGYDGKSPYLAHYGRNRAYTWQRITSWILLVAIIAHVVHMRFIEYPAKTHKGIDKFYMVKVDADPGIYTLSERLKVNLYGPKDIENLKMKLPLLPQSNELVSVQAQNIQEQHEFVRALQVRSIKENQYIAVAKNFGTAELLMLRETFKMPIMMFLYTIFVLAACFHAFNGVWTFLISWGVTISQRSQKALLKISKVLMLIVGFLGLITIFGTYWINLRR